MIDRWTTGRLATADAPRHWQSTVRRSVACRGIGLHSGLEVTLRLHPAPAGHGVVFRRTDLGAGALIPARHDLVADTRLCTLLASPADPTLRVGTIEHLMAALAASGVDNVLVDVDAPELPIMDGSALPFLGLIGDAGIRRQAEPRRAVEIRRHVRVADGEAWAELLPPRPIDAASGGLSVDVAIDFAAPAIGRQSLALGPVDAAVFRAELAECRTFAMAGDIEALRAGGLARGGSLDNAVVVDGARVLNPGGLRRPDEFVRHKMLDAIGDLALAGAPLAGRFRASRPGHGLNNRLLRALFADRANWRLADPAARRPAAIRVAA